jgi:hypothetical protein
VAVGGDHGAFDVYVPVGFDRMVSFVFPPRIVSEIASSADVAGLCLRSLADKEGV